MVLVSSFGIGWSAPVAGTALGWVGLAGEPTIPKNIAGIRTINRLSFRSVFNCFSTLEKTLDASGTGTAFWFDQTICTKLVFENIGTRFWYRLLASLGGIGSSAPIVGSCLGWPRGRSGVERLRHGKRGVHIKYGIALIETIRVLYRRVGAENFEEALDELREALSTIVRLLFDYLDVDQLAEFLERMGR